MAKHVNQKVDLATLMTIKSAFLSEYPNSIIGFVPVREEKTVRFVVKVKSKEDFDKLPKEFRGYAVQGVLVAEKQFDRLMKYEKDAEQ